MQAGMHAPERLGISSVLETDLQANSMPLLRSITVLQGAGQHCWVVAATGVFGDPAAGGGAAGSDGSTASELPASLRGIPAVVLT